MKREFKVGDRVSLDESSWYYGQCNNSNGTIYKENTGDNWQYVKWDRGDNDLYKNEHLTLLIKKEEAMLDDKTVEAIKKSVVHWEENVNKTINGTLALDDYQSDYCALCNMFGSAYCASNNDCPLNLRGMKCSLDDSPWDIFNDNQTPENARNMVLALKSLFYPEEEKKEVFYHVSQRFIDSCGTEHILGDANGRECILLSLGNGNRNCNPIKVENTQKITEEEFKQICGSGRFTLKESK